MNDSRYYDEKYLTDRLKNLGDTTKNINSDYKTKEQIENEQLRQENEMLKQRLQMAADPIRAEFEQSEEFRNAWLTNIVSYLYEVNMAQWAQSPYAKKLDEWTSSRIEEIRASRQQPVQQLPQKSPQTPAQQNVKNKTAQTAQVNQEDDNSQLNKN